MTEEVSPGLDAIDEAEFPRVLIVGRGFDLVSGGGITLHNLFKGWPADRLAVAASGEMIDSACRLNGHEYRLGSLEARWIPPFSLVPSRGEESGPVFIEQEAGSSIETSAAHGAVEVEAKGKARRLFYAGIQGLGVRPLLKRLGLSAVFLDWARQIRPQVVYTQLASLGAIQFVAALVQALDLPLVVHIMDDWPSVVYEHGLLSGYVRGLVDRDLRRLLERTNVCMAICEGMAEAFAGRYGRAWTVFHNTVDLERWTGLPGEAHRSDTTFRITYSGRVGSGMNGSVEDICRAVDRLASRGRHLTMDIYTGAGPQTRRALEQDFKAVRVHGPLPDDKVPATLAASDLLVLPYGFSERSMLFARYSFPTKAPGYMASGTPILLYAPEQYWITSDVRARGWAEIVSEQGVDGLGEAISRLMNDDRRRGELASRARSIAVAEFDARVVRPRFREALAAAARGERY